MESRTRTERDGSVRIRLATAYAVGDVNCFVLPGDPLTVVDAGESAAAALADLEAGFEQLGLRIEDVEQVLLTHHHADHVGLAHQIHERSGCVVAGQRLLLDYLTDARAQRSEETEYHVGVLERNGAPPDVIESHRALQVKLFGGVESVLVTAPFDDGAVLEAGGRRLRAVVRPGHSATDTLYVDDAGGVAFVGDHLLSDKSSDPLVWRPPGPEPDPGQRDSVLSLYREALAQTARLDVDLMHAGHGDPVEDHAPLVASRLALHDQHCERALRALAGPPRSAYAIAEEIWGEKVRQIPYDLISMILGSLDLLRTAGSARVELGPDGAFLYAAAD
jgi:glyoxylase-like metal-dependent hydrolase (beta-lactamase superfamily II)